MPSIPTPMVIDQYLSVLLLLKGKKAEVIVSQVKSSTTYAATPGSYDITVIISDVVHLTNLLFVGSTMCGT